MGRWAGGITAVLVLAATIALAQLWPEPDFAPFVMTIEEWSSARIGYADGRSVAGTSVYRLEYRSRGDWSLTLISDDLGQQALGEGPACRGGVRGQIRADGTFVAQSTDPALCNGVGRWIHYGVAWSYRWKREIDGRRITYTDPGERVVFDRFTGLPLLYEAGLTRGQVGQRSVFRVDRE